MSLIKRGKYYSYDFIFRGERKQGPTHQTSRKLAAAVEVKIKNDLTMGHFGLAPKGPTPTFRKYMETTFAEHCARHAKAAATAKFYRKGIKRLVEWLPWRDLRLDEVNADWIGRYTDHRAKSVALTSVNAELAVLRKAMLYAADELKLIPRVKVRVLPVPGGGIREFVIPAELERAYLAAASYPLRGAAILTLDLGLRPGEVVRLKKTDIVNGCVIVRTGKSKNATRSLPLTTRAAREIEILTALWPDSEFLFPGRKIQGVEQRHLTPEALSNAHILLRSKHPEWPADFILYSERHTFGTGLAESGANPYQIKAIMGHSSVKISERYIHPQSDGLLVAMKQKELLDQATRGEERLEVPTDFTTDAAK